MTVRPTHVTSKSAFSLTQRARVYSHETLEKHFSFMGVRRFEETTVVSA